MAKGDFNSYAHMSTIIGHMLAASRYICQTDEAHGPDSHTGTLYSHTCSAVSVTGSPTQVQRSSLLALVRDQPHHRQQITSVYYHDSRRRGFHASLCHHEELGKGVARAQHASASMHAADAIKIWSCSCSACLLASLILWRQSSSCPGNSC